MEIEKMTYREFKDYCNDRACDGQWGMRTAIACCGLVSEVQAAVRAKLFKKRAEEKAWQDIKAKYFCNSESNA